MKTLLLNKNTGKILVERKKSIQQLTDLTQLKISNWGVKEIAVVCQNHNKDNLYAGVMENYSDTDLCILTPDMPFSPDLYLCYKMWLIMVQLTMYRNTLLEKTDGTAEGGVKYTNLILGALHNIMINGEKLNG